MITDAKKDVIFLRHILEEIAKIERSVDGLTEEDFKKDQDTQDATLRRLEVIGEAVKNLSAKLKSTHPSIDWKKIAGTRDVIIHAYFRVDLGLTWEIARKDLAILKKETEKILKGIS